MKTPSILLFLTILYTTSCKPTPEQLGKETCDCYREAKANKNPDNQIEKTEECNNKNQLNLMDLKDIEKSEDMNEDQMRDFEARYNSIIEKCN